MDLDAVVFRRQSAAVRRRWRAGADELARSFPLCRADVTPPLRYDSARRVVRDRDSRIRSRPYLEGVRRARHRSGCTARLLLPARALLQCFRTAPDSAARATAVGDRRRRLLATIVGSFGYHSLASLQPRHTAGPDRHGVRIG